MAFCLYYGRISANLRLSLGQVCTPAQMREMRNRLREDLRGKTPDHLLLRRRDDKAPELMPQPVRRRMVCHRKGAFNPQIQETILIWLSICRRTTTELIKATTEDNKPIPKTIGNTLRPGAKSQRVRRSDSILGVEHATKSSP